MNSRDLPEVRSSFWEIKDLPRIEQALEFVQESCTLISSTFRIDENDYGLKVLRWNWLDYKCFAVFVATVTFLDGRPPLLFDRRLEWTLQNKWITSCSMASHPDSMNLHHSHLLIVCSNYIRLEWILKKHWIYYEENWNVTVALWYRLPLGTEQVVSSIPGSVGYISHVHWAYDYLGPFAVLWVHMAWHKNCVKKEKKKILKATWHNWPIFVN